MKKIIIVVAFLLVSILSFPSSNKEIVDFNQSDKCTITVSGYDEWGCHFKHTYEYTGDISRDDCYGLRIMIEIIYKLMS